MKTSFPPHTAMITIKYTLILLVTQVARHARADIVFPFDVPDADNHVSQTCLQAMAKNIPQCPPNFYFQAFNDDFGPFSNETAQDSFCSKPCLKMVQQHHSDILKACQGEEDPWEGVPADYGSGKLVVFQNLVCLLDQATKTYCSGKQPWKRCLTYWLR